MTLTAEEIQAYLTLMRNQAETIRETGSTEGILWDGRPVIMMSMTSSVTGKPRSTPVMRVEHGGSWAVVGSKGGAPQDPVWCEHLRATPVLDVLDGVVSHRCTAREVTGEEKALWWERAVVAFPSYATYQEMVDRPIPVFVLERSEPAS